MSKLVCKQVGMEISKFWLLMLCARYLIVAVKVASSIFVNELNAKNLKSSKTPFQFELSLFIFVSFLKLRLYKLCCGSM